MSIIKNVLSNFPEDHRKRRKHFESVVRESCGECKHVVRKQTARLLASLKSSEKTSCVPGVFGCTELSESGYNPYEALPQLLSYLLESYAIDVQVMGKPRDKLIEQVILDLERTVKLMMDGKSSYQRGWHHLHVEHVTKQLQVMKPRDQITYHIGYPGHSFYAVWLKNSDHSVTCYINNLGQGLYKHYKDQEGYAYPYVLSIPQGMIASHVKTLVSCLFNRRSDYKTLIEAIYGSGHPMDAHNLPGVPQSTGNCVIKNWLCAARCSLSLDGDRGESYRRLFNGMLSTLSSQSIMGNHGLAGFDLNDVAQASIKSQHSHNRHKPCDVLDDITLYIDPSFQASSNSVSETGMATGDILSKPELQALAGAPAGIMAFALTRFSVEKTKMPEWAKWGISILSGLAVGGGSSHIAGKRYGKGLTYKPKPVSASSLVRTCCTRPVSKRKIIETQQGNQLRF
jgi:hypothetical protein